MKKLSLIDLFSLIVFSAIAQTPPAEYYVFVKKGDSLAAIKQYKPAALAYTAAFKTFGDKGYVPDRYHAACAWAMAGFPDSAISNLVRIAEKAKYDEYEILISEPQLVSLHNDPGWQTVVKLVKENSDKTAGIDKPLRRLLDSLVTEDQKWRNHMTKHGNGELGRNDTLSREAIVNMVHITDSIDYIYVQDIFKKYGFPNYDLVGEKGTADFWLLVQHQDYHPSFQDSVLKKMKPEVDRNKASYNNYAYLLDRVKVNTGQLQVYGTQMTLNADSTSYIPKPVENPQKLNERRNDAGLGTIESYIEAMNNRYRGTLRKNLH